MKAVRLFGIQDARLVEESGPEPEPGRVVLDVSQTALCRTDAKMWAMGQRDLVLPRILGHEVAVRDPEDGQNYVVWPGNACGDCDLCRVGRQNLCRHMKLLGFHLDGGLAEKISVSPSSLIALPPGLNSKIATLAEPLGCGLNALERLSLAQRETCLIFGGGPVGLLLASAVVRKGGRPFVVEPNPDRLKRGHRFMEALGIEHQARVPNRSFDTAINAAPDGAILAEALERLRPAGRFCLFSGLTWGPEFSPGLINEIHYRELVLIGAYGCTRDQMAAALELLSDFSTEVEQLIDRRIRLEQVPEVLADVWDSRVMKCVVELEA